MRKADPRLTAMQADEDIASEAAALSGALRAPGPSLRPLRAQIARALVDHNHDDGSLAPLMIRFAWHCSGTYCKDSGTGGSNGATMFLESDEAKDGENRGLGKARQLVRQIQAKHASDMSLADLSILCGYVAIESTGGPRIPFGVGRADFDMSQAVASTGKPSGCPFGDGKFNPSGSRLPAADLGPDPSVAKSAPRCQREHATISGIRGTFNRLGFSDKDTVCLIVLGHQYGRCHPDVSGYEHPWYTFDPGHWNVYGPGGLGYLSIYSFGVSKGDFKEVKSSAGKRQFNGPRMGPEPFMMLTSDMALWWDPEYNKHVLWYDNHRNEFRADAARLFKTLTELGCSNLVPEKP